MSTTSFVVLLGSVLQTHIGQVTQNQTNCFTTKQSIMKTYHSFFTVVVLVVTLTFSCTSCSKDEAPTLTEIADTDQDGIADDNDNCPNAAGPASNNGCPVNEENTLETGDGIAEEDIETYQGDVGIVISVRVVARKGYVPARVQLTIQGTTQDFSRTIDLDANTFLAQVKLPVSELDESDLEILKNGVEVEATLFDANDALLSSKTFTSVLFKSNPSLTEWSANELPDLNTDVALVPNTPYYIQVIRDGEPIQRAAFRRVFENDPLRNNIISTTSDVQFTGNEENSAFFFEPVANKANHFNIKHQESDTYLKSIRYLNTDLNVVQAGHDAANNDRLNQQFVVRKVGNGIYELIDAFYEPIKVISGLGLGVGEADGEELLIRLIPMNIEWFIEEIETHYLEPVLPAATNGINFNSTLINCGSGPLEQTITTARKKQTATVVGWEESISFMSTTTSSYSVTLGLEVEGKFFGSGASYSAEATGGQEFTTQNATENTNWKEIEFKEDIEVETDRTITIPAKSAVLAYDIFQVYNNIKIDVVQRVQVRAINQESGQPLSGEQITTQFHFNGFNGVITQVGADYVEVTMRAVANMEEVFKTKSDIQEVAANCGG